MIDNFYMEVGDEFHCLTCHKDMPSADDGAVKHSKICIPKPTYCDQNCKNPCIRNCLNCFKPLEKALECKNFVTGEWDGHTYKCACYPGMFISIG